NTMPKVSRVALMNRPLLGVSVEGSEAFWTGKNVTGAKLATFNTSSQATHYIELFNRGEASSKFNIKAPKYIHLSKTNGILENDERIAVSIIWNLATKGISNSNIIISGNDGDRITLPFTIDNRYTEVKNMFVEQNGVISMEAPHYSRANHNRPFFWKHLENYGKTAGGMTVYPSAVADQKLDSKTPYLEYDIFISNKGNYTLHTLVSPTLDFKNGEGLR